MPVVNWLEKGETSALAAGAAGGATNTMDGLLEKAPAAV